jgi:hypothetical protein
MKGWRTEAPRLKEKNRKPRRFDTVEVCGSSPHGPHAMGLTTFLRAYFYQFRTAETPALLPPGDMASIKKSNTTVCRA